MRERVFIFKNHVSVASPYTSECRNISTRYKIRPVHRFRATTYLSLPRLCLNPLSLWLNPPIHHLKQLDRCIILHRTLEATYITICPVHRHQRFPRGVEALKRGNQRSRKIRQLRRRVLNTYLRITIHRVHQCRHKRRKMNARLRLWLRKRMQNRTCNLSNRSGTRCAHLRMNLRLPRPIMTSLP